MVMQRSCKSQNRVRYLVGAPVYSKPKMAEWSKAAVCKTVSKGAWVRIPLFGPNNQGVDKFGLSCLAWNQESGGSNPPTLTIREENVMKEVFRCFYGQEPESDQENATAMRSAHIEVAYDVPPTVTELVDAFREFLKAAGYLK